jgi:GDP-L-fucose synthase
LSVIKGDIVFDSSKLDGTMRKLLNVDRLAKLGWRYQIPFEKGLQQTYDWFLSNKDNLLA